VITKYARSGDASIAYHVAGGGPVELLYVPGPASNVELMWEESVTARYLERIASFARLVMFDRRGSGLSDAVDRPPTLEQQMDDARAVVAAAGLSRPALFGVTDAGLCALYAATYPGEVTALVLWEVAACGAELLRPGLRGAFLDVLEQGWGQGSLMPLYAPSGVGDSRFSEWWARYERASVSPGMARQLLEFAARSDIRDVLPNIRVPTLVLHRADSALVPVALGRDVADRIPSAKFVEVPGQDNYPWQGDVASWFPQFEEFLTGVRQPHAIDRVLASVLFTDIVESTGRAAELGDRRWRELLLAHNDVVRREIDAWRGSVIKTTGDGFLATFDGPARAVSCALAIVQQVRQLGLEVRAGVHTGECERLGADVGGMAVHIGARVAALATPGEVLASRTVRDLVVGSGLRFHDRGSHDLKGVPDAWQLYAVEPGSGLAG
jgi:class 3 adenylate cyclase/pimeloyl-ACP methyl ester carboxylesterase